MRVLLVGSMCMAGALLGQDDGKIYGTWQSSEGPAQTWVFEERGDQIHVVQTKEGEKLADYTCNTFGRDCNIRIGKDKATISMYLNGQALVQMETRGSNVLKRRFELHTDTGKLELEIVPIVSKEKAETIMLSRSSSTAAK